MHTRFARFQNVPEMLRSTWHGFADVKTAEDRKAALDMQLVTSQPASAPGKLQAAAENIARLYHATREREYLDPVTGRSSSTPGALQIVFCDLSTPGGEGWSAYDQLRDELVDRGVPADRVRYIHETRDDLEKARLFAACRAGHVNVILGSTQKMGVGTNIQARAIALHHLDCPWRPADVAQRDGRIMRQGNRNSQVGVYRYVTEGSSIPTCGRRTNAKPAVAAQARFEYET